MTDDAAPRIVHDEAGARFAAADAEDTAFLAYRREGQRITLLHTEVDPQLEGRGLGSALVRAALDHAEEQGLTVVPVCRFVSGWLDRHAERAAQLDIAER